MDKCGLLNIKHSWNTTIKTAMTFSCYLVQELSMALRYKPAFYSDIILSGALWPCGRLIL